MFHWLVVAQIRTLDPFFPHSLLAAWVFAMEVFVLGFLGENTSLLEQERICVCSGFIRAARGQEVDRGWGVPGHGLEWKMDSNAGDSRLGAKPHCVLSLTGSFTMNHHAGENRWQHGGNIVLKSYLVLCLWKMRHQQGGCKVERVWFNGCLK